MAALLSVDVAHAANFVTVKAFATEEYLKEMALRERDKVQTYNFMEGIHFKGKSRDKGVENFKFKDLIVDLAEHLVKQDYYLHPDLGEADQLIVVHYGATDFEEDYLELMGIENAADLMAMGLEEKDVLDMIAVMQSMGDLANQSGRMSKRDKAHLLGIDHIRDQPDYLYSDYEYEQMLKEARYFVVLMAFDYRLIRETGEKKLLWSTRYNIRTRGQSFETAVKEMNLIASDYFGKNFDKLIRKRQDDKSRVEIGEIEVIQDDDLNADSNYQNP